MDQTSFQTGLARVETPPLRGLVFVYITLFLDIMGSTLLMPIVPYIVRQYNSDALTVGLLSVVYSAAAFFSAPALGRLSDRWGRRPVLLVSVLGSAAGYALFGMGGALWVLFLSRLVDGFTGGNIATAMAYIADVTPPKERARNFAFGGVAFGLGFIFGPVIASALSPLSLAAPAFAAGGLSLASFLFGLFFLPESLPEASREQRPFRPADANPLAVLAELGRLPGLGPLLAAIFILYFALNGLFSYIAVFTLQRFSAALQQNGLLFMLVGFFQMLGQGLIVYRLAARIGEKKTALLGLALQALAYPLFAAAPGFGWLYPLAALTALGNAFSRPALDALIANQVAPHEQGRAAGAAAGLYSLTSILGPLAAGLAYDFISPASIFIAAGLLLAAAAMMIARVKTV